MPSGPIVCLSDESCFSKLLLRSGSLSRNCRVNICTLEASTHRSRLRLRPLPRVRAGVLRELLRLLQTLLDHGRRVGERVRVEALGRELAEVAREVLVELLRLGAVLVAERLELLQRLAERFLQLRVRLEQRLQLVGGEAEGVRGSSW